MGCPKVEEDETEKDRVPEEALEDTTELEEAGELVPEPA